MAQYTTEADRRNYGDDLLDTVARKAYDTVHPYVQQLEQRVQRSERANIFHTLDAALPNWRTVNTSREFLSWLSVPDPLSGNRKDSMLRHAFEIGDAARVLVFFRGFLASGGAARGNQAPGQQARQDSSMIDNATLKTFYDNCRKGMYAGKDAERNA